MTATQEAPPISPDITVKPVNRKPRQAPFPFSIYQSAVGKKWAMALSGVGLMGFVAFHALGNFKMYLGPEAIDTYSESLRSLLHPVPFPDFWFLWIMRVGLIGMFLLHFHAAYSLTMMNRRARPVRYQSKRDYIAANFASRTMRWSGIIILVFLVIHLANLTWGWFPSDVEHPHEFVPVYHNIVVSLSIPWLAAVYIIAQLALAVHLFHGAWSLFQSLGVNNPRFNGLRRGFAIGFAAVVCGVNISFPIAVLTGVVSN